MQTEIEAKWLDVDKYKIRNKLKQAGAKQVHPERLMTRRNFDYPDGRLEKISGWVRVRDEANKITLSYKQMNDRSIHGTKEVDVVVNDADAVCEFLKSIGLEQKSFQETKRESWMLDDIEIEIDTWPWIPSFVEIEASSEDKVFQVAKQLGLTPEDALHGSVEIAYQALYDVTEEEVNGWENISFIDTPGWLLEKKIK